MKFERHQVCLIFDKLYKEIKGDISNIFDNNGDPKYIVDISDNEGKLNKLRFGTPEGRGTFLVHIERESTSGFKIQMNKNSFQISGKYEYVYVLPFLWSTVWWKWRRLSKMIMKNLFRLRNIEAEMRRRQNEEDFNMVYTEIFPDEVNKILLGAKDD